MNKDRIKGKIEDIKGRAKRQAGEWTGDEKLQSEGAVDQARGKVQNVWGKVKDSAHDLKEDIKDTSRNKEIDRETEEEDKVARSRKRKVA